MSRADGVIRRVDAALNKTQAHEKTVSKRFTTVTGGDPLIGRGGTVTHDTTVLDPQPIYGRLGRETVGPTQKAMEVISGNEGRIANDYQIILSSSSISEDELHNETLTIVFTDASGNEDIFHLTDYEPVAFGGKVIMFVAYVRSAARQ